MGLLEEIAELVDEALRHGRHFVSGLSRKLLEQFALTCVQLRRHLDEDPHVEITTHLVQLSGIQTRVERRQTLTAKPQHTPGLRALWNLELDLAVERRHFDFRTEDRLDKGTRDLEMQICAIALEQGMIPKRDDTS
jgi:hypothetical protein